MAKQLSLYYDDIFTLDGCIVLLINNAVKQIMDLRICFTNNFIAYLPQSGHGVCLSYPASTKYKSHLPKTYFYFERDEAEFVCYRMLTSRY